MSNDFIYWIFYHFPLIPARLKRRSTGGGGFEKKKICGAPSLVRHRMSPFCGAPARCATESWVSVAHQPRCATECPQMDLGPMIARGTHRNSVAHGVSCATEVWLSVAHGWACATEFWLSVAHGQKMRHRKSKISVAHQHPCATEIILWRTN